MSNLIEIFIIAKLRRGSIWDGSIEMKSPTGFWEAEIKAKKRLIQVSLGKMSADLYLENCRLVNVNSGEILESHNLAISRQLIAYTGPSRKMVTRETKVIDARGAFLLPGYIDPHAHLDFLVNPLALMPYLLVSGTTTVMTDPHDLVGAVGLAGLDFLIEKTRNLPIKFFFTLPVSSPPFPEFEGQDLVSPSDMERYLSREEILALSEVTPWTRLIAADRDLIAKFALAERWGKNIEGHAPGVSFDKLNALRAAGLTSCHESVVAEEARERLRMGLAVMLRHGSIRSDLKELLSFVTEEPKIDTRRVMLTPDWKSPRDLLKQGYLDHLVRLSIEQGLPPLVAIQMATLNPASYLRLERNLGSLTPGSVADVLLVDDLNQATPRIVIAKGDLVIEEGKFLFEFPSMPASARNIPWLSRRKIPDSIHATNFVVKTPTFFGRIAVPTISVVNKTITEKQEVILPIKSGQIFLPADKDILKISILNKESTGFVTSFLAGFGAKVGGLATSLAHEHHKPMVIGCDEKDMAAALLRLKEIGGGLVLVQQGRIMKEIPLVIGGVMSIESLKEVAKKMQAMNQTLKDMHSFLEDPIFTLSFLSFSSLPWIRMTPSGLLDVKKKEIIWP